MYGLVLVEIPVIGYGGNQLEPFDLESGCYEPTIPTDDYQWPFVIPQMPNLPPKAKATGAADDLQGGDDQDDEDGPEDDEDDAPTSGHYEMPNWLHDRCKKQLTALQRAWLTDLRRRYSGHNNGDLFQRRDTSLKQYGVSPHTLAKAINGLEEKGYVQVTKPYRPPMRDELTGKIIRSGEAARYRLCWLPCDVTGAEPTLRSNTPVVSMSATMSATKIKDRKCDRHADRWSPQVGPRAQS